MRKILTTPLAMVAVLTFASAASAQTWAEIDDAGDLPDAAQVLIGTGPISAITGTISSPTDVDLFQIFLTGGRTFSATTVVPTGTLANTQLFLFDADGIGVYANDDFTPSNPRSILPAGSPFTPSAPGLYLLAISGFNRDPVSPGGPIFPSAPPIGIFGPTGPGGGQPVSGYSGTGGTGTYTIVITSGAEFAAIPEPGTLTLLGAGVLGLLGLGRRRLPATGSPPPRSRE
jgi:hypothetical protein